MSKSTSSWHADPVVVRAAEGFVRSINVSGGVPSFVLELPGPIRAKGLESAMQELLSDVPSLVWQRWSREYLPDGLGNLCLPFQVYKDAGVPDAPKRLGFDFAILISNPEDALRFGRMHVSKSSQLSMLPQRHVVNVPDVESWRQQRRSIIDAFLPKSVLAPTIPVLEKMADDMVAQLLAHGGESDEVDVKAWMHHTALAMFIQCMMGDARAFPAVPRDGSPADLTDGSSDLLFAQTTPENSAPVRALFNLETLGRYRSPEEIQRRFSSMLGYAGKLLRRAECRRASGERTGPLMERLLEIADPEVRFSNTIATLIAGHDTTAYTMQYVLMELARHPSLQRRARAECGRVLRAAEEVKGHRNGGSPLVSFDGLPRYEFLTRCITEALRLWNVAAVTFARTTSFADELTGACGVPVRVPSGTHFTFWNYGLHHSTALWGQSAMDFEPDRVWHPHELQRGVLSGEPPALATTPTTARFHPFSVAPRDCMGKGFALTEMRVLLPRLLRAFWFDVPAGSEIRRLRGPVRDDPTFAAWARAISGPVQPHALRLYAVPTSRL